MMRKPTLCDLPSWLFCLPRSSRAQAWAGDDDRGSASIFAPSSSRPRPSHQGQRREACPRTSGSRQFIDLYFEWVR